jgi:hypothetical protein
VKWLDETTNSNNNKNTALLVAGKTEPATSPVPTPALASSKKSLGQKEVEGGAAVATSG